MQDIIKRAAPPQRIKVNRLTPELKALPIDHRTGIRLDTETAKCLRVFGRARGWTLVQERDGNSVIIWRIA